MHACGLPTKPARQASKAQSQQVHFLSNQRTPEAESGPHLVAFRGVVEHHVQDDLNAALVALLQGWAGGKGVGRQGVRRGGSRGEATSHTNWIAGSTWLRQPRLHAAATTASAPPAACATSQPCHPTSPRAPCPSQPPPADLDHLLELVQHIVAAAAGGCRRAVARHGRKVSHG